MSWRQMKALDLIHVEKEPSLIRRDWLAATGELLAGGARPVSVFSQRTNDDYRVWMAFAPGFCWPALPNQHSVCLKRAPGLCRALI